MPDNALFTDEYWMRKALGLARKAVKAKEVPVGALIVRDNRLLASAYNRRETWLSPIAHAEIIALQRASQKLAAWRLSGCTIYVTLEPCPMCAGALVQARIGRVVFGAFDKKSGAVHSLYQLCEDPRLNHRLQVKGGVLESQCSELLTQFFQHKRQLSKKAP